jgi:hypothetical protein
MSATITPKDVVAMAIRVSKFKKVGYDLAAKQLSLSWETIRKIDEGMASGGSVPTEVVCQAFEAFRQQRIGQIRAEMKQLLEEKQ